LLVAHADPHHVASPSRPGIPRTHALYRLPNEVTHHHCPLNQAIRNHLASADTAAAEPELVAHHFTQAGVTDGAIEWWGKAGEQALRRSAFQGAISHLSRVLARRPDRI
jgi:hypothetical protein